MQRIVIFLLVIMFFSPLTSYAAETYQLDTNHTYVQWHASHFGFSSPSGKWLANGTLILDEKAPDKSSVDVTIQMNELSTGIPKFDKHLMSADFFDVAKYPTATFVSNKVTLTDKESAKVQGVLTLHGVSKPFTLNVKLNKKGISPINNKETVGFSAHATVKRSEFGISSFLPGISDDVLLDIEAEGTKQ